MKKGIVLWSMMVPWLVTIVLTLALTYRLDQNQKHSDRDWCDLLTSLVRPDPSTPPPTTKRAKDIANKIEVLRRHKGCKLSALSLSGVPSVTQRQNLLLELRVS